MLSRGVSTYSCFSYTKLVPNAHHRVHALDLEFVCELLMYFVLQEGQLLSDTVRTSLPRLFLLRTERLYLTEGKCSETASKIK